MADGSHPIRPQRTSERHAAQFGLPTPVPFTAEQEAAYQAKLADGDRQVDEILARRTPYAA
jgi:hypothetical protein